MTPARQAPHRGLKSDRRTSAAVQAKAGGAEGVHQVAYAVMGCQWGLIVAIPSLILYGFLSRKAKSVVDHMEKDFQKR